jgi:serine/threonine protein kinase
MINKYDDKRCNGKNSWYKKKSACWYGIVDNDFYLNYMELSLDYRIYKSYRVENKIGKGVYGEVFKVVEKSTEKPFAIKKIFDAFQNLTDAKRTYR